MMSSYPKAFRVGGVVMAALMLVIGVAFGTVIWTIRRERAEEEKKKLASEMPKQP